MCSSRGLCGGRERPPSSGGSSSGSQYALCALGVGLVALGIVMIVWTVVPADKQALEKVTPGNSSTLAPGNHTEKDGGTETSSSSSVAYVLVGSGAVMLLLSICLGVRNKRRDHQRAGEPVAVGVPFLDHVAGEPGQTTEVPAPTYDVPSYIDAVGSGQYPIRSSNLRHSTSQLPSYEDLISAVENEAAGPGAEAPKPTPAAAAGELQPAAAPPAAAAAARPPTRTGSRASRILRPLRVRRIKSEKLHLKDVRLNIGNPTPGNRVTIEPITPPPQYDDKAPEFK
ncbi:transmembrane protein 51b [Aplochiton taeniatus]